MGILRPTLQEKLDAVPAPGGDDYKRHALQEKARALLQSVSSELRGIEADLVELKDDSDMPGAITDAACDIDELLAKFPKIKTPDEEYQARLDEVESEHDTAEHERIEINALHSHLTRRA